MSRALRVAIACQGGESHAAFVAGVLCKLLGPDLQDRFKDTLNKSGMAGGIAIGHNLPALAHRCS
jgi:NTE family protein